MVFRRENKVDAFQRQISALRQQLGADAESTEEGVTPYPADQREASSSLDAPGFGTREAAGFAFGGFGAAGLIGNAAEPAPAAAPVIPAAAADAHVSVVAHDTTWTGELQSKGTIHVHGRVEGAVTAAQDVYVAEEADVDASISATNVIVAGLVKGTIRCGGRFEVLPQGRIVGDVQAPTLVVHEGAIVNGQFRMGAAEAATGRPEAGQQPKPTVVHRRAGRGG